MAPLCDFFPVSAAFRTFRRLRLPVKVFWLLLAGPLASSIGQAAPPQVVLRVGHNARVSQAIFSPGGRTLATLGDDGAVNLWDARTGARRVHWQPMGTYPNQIAFAPDGALLAVSGITGTLGETTGSVTVLDARTGAIRQTLHVTPSGPPDVNDFAWSPDGTVLAIVRRTAPAALWDAATAALRTTLPAETTGATGVLFSPDGSVVVTRFDAPRRPRPGLNPGIEPKAPSAWDAHTGAVASAPALAALPPDLSGLPTLATGPQGRLVFGDMERQDVEFEGRVIPGRRVVATTPVFFDPATGKGVRGAKVTGPLTDVQWSEDGRRVAAANRDTLLVFDTVTGATAATIPTGQFTDAVALSPDGADVAAGEEDGTVAAGEEDGTVAVFAVASAGLQASWSAPGRTTQVQAFALSPDGSRLVSAHADGTLALWDLRTGSLIQALRLPGFKLVTLAISPDGKTLATSEARQRLTATMMDSGVPPADLRLWDMPGLTVRKVIPGTDPRYAWSALAFSPDGTLLAGVHQSGGMHLSGTPGDSAPAVLWDGRTGEVKQELGGSFASPQALAFAPKGGLLALGDANTFDLYDLPAFALRPSVAPNAGGFTSLAFSSDGQTLITGNDSGRVRFWPLTGTDQERREGRYAKDAKTGLPAGEAPINALGVSPDGTTVASGSGDGTIRLWTIMTGGLAGTLTGHEGRVTAVQYAPGGLLLSSGADGTIRVWDARTDTLRATLTLLPATHPLPPPPAAARDDASPNSDGMSPPAPVVSDVNWISWTPAGYYLASSGAGQFVDWQRNGQSIPPAERRARWNRPAEVQTALSASKP